MIIELTDKEVKDLYSLLLRNTNSTKSIHLDTVKDRQILWDLECLIEKQLPPEWVIASDDLGEKASPKPEQLPINSKDFSEYIKSSDIFKITKEYMIVFLSNWYYHENKDDFIECMGTELDKVINTYRFHNQSVSIVKNYNFDEPNQDYIHCAIDIFNDKGDFITGYKAIYDFLLNIDDDTLY